jgi:signal transduction histidine kinase/CheY-like chemotaxis protein/HPt (histidine-containing phosphotransfer) domain-containing protein
MAPNSIFESFLVGQGYALFESLGGGKFVPVGDCPSWCRDILDLTSETKKPIAPANNSPFLENFLIDAEDFWNSKTEGALNSGNWTERDENGREVPLEAFALSLDNKKILILQNLSAHFTEQQQWFQTARDSLLAHEQLLSEIQKKEILLHCIVHDLSQPLTAITGCFNLLRLEKMPPVVEKYVEAGLRESQRQESMIRGILSAFSGDLMAQQASRHSGGAVPDLSVCAQQAVEEVSSAFKDKDVRLRFSPPPHDSPDWRVVGDAPRLDRIFGNLLENTLRYSPPKSTVTIGLEDQGGYILAFVDDEGPGLPKDLPTNQLFALFSKGKNHSGKAGLGLYFCKITVERWGGTIGAETRAQGGSRFWFRLPRANAKLRDSAAEPAHAPAENHSGPSQPSAGTNGPPTRVSRIGRASKRLRVLVTEDTEINRELISELLTKRGHSVSAVSDGLEALAAFEREPFDVILMDQEMPNMNGLDATRAIRKLETSTGRHVRIIGLTGNATSEDERRCLNAGMDAFLSKPVRMEKLYEAVESKLQLSSEFDHSQPAPVPPDPGTTKEAIAEHEAVAQDESVAAHLHRATGGNQKLQRTLVKSFLQDAPKTLSLIRRAIAKKDALKLASAAHALKGSISIFGAAKAVAVARELEAMGRSGHLFDAGPQFRALESEFQRLKPELQAISSVSNGKPKPKRKTKPKSRRAR